MKKVLVGTVLACLALAPSAMAGGQVTDPCGISGVGTLPDAYPEPTVPWLDLCNTDIAGFATSAGRGIDATINVAGDTDLRGSSAAYALHVHIGDCYYQLQYADLGLDSADYTSRIQGQCNIPTLYNCDLIFGCDPPEEDNEVDFDIRDSAALTGTVTSGGLTGSTIKLHFDPSKLEAGSAPQELLDGLAPGSAVITSATTYSFVRAGAAAVTGREGGFDMVDWGYGGGGNISLD